MYKVRYVYKKYKVTSTPKVTNYSPSQCLQPAKNCQSTSSTVKTLATYITKPVVYNVTTNLTNNSCTTQSPSAETDTCSTATCSTSSSLDSGLAAGSSETIDSPQVSYTLVTKTLSTYEKAEAIFNWARDKLEYSFYYNTRKGALGTLTSGSGNCCDLSHAIVAMARSIGIPARYVYGSCKFSSGTMGHVWAQLYVNGKWYCADASNNMNSFGVIRNWNTNSWTLKGIYKELPF
ncbi:transglutaminase-like domain-containing protein [Methanobacterium aggregans]|uniref:transglutaminase-like domain-containing protein n=1 Tax=Methanobacterium aggregans TaxID=1615586 RepID=UPI0032111600